jgi:glutamate-ammonia-ligase adenylyltransferase
MDRRRRAAVVLPETWPVAADEAAAGRLAERFVALGGGEARLARSVRGAAVLRAIGGNSPYLAELALKEAATLRGVLAEGAEPVVARLMARLGETPVSGTTAALAASLRRAKRQMALAVGLADIGGAWGVERVVGALSAFAEAALQLAVDHLLLRAAARGEVQMADPAEPSVGSGFVVLGMGKLGARELNYSSDIDLVLLYDPAPLQSARADGAMGEDGSGERAACFSRIARGLVALMQQRDADGYVFRTDLRLRPDPAATPPAVSLPAALIYYESMGQNWERAAMLKARPVAGDLVAGQGFLDAIRPFIWRRGLDFAAVADIQAMKRRIDVHRGDGARPVAAIGGFDLKLGQGGIREIEFLAQTLQLVWGGRDPMLRDPTTLGALRVLARAGHISRAGAGELAEAYVLLRRLEHRVQMVADRQTHVLPQGGAELDRFAVFFGLADGAALARLLGGHLACVRRRYAEVFETVTAAGPGEDGGGLDFSGPDAQPATLAGLASLGFGNGAAIVAAVQGWQAGRVRALRSERARALIGQMLPALLAAFARQPEPDSVFLRFDQFLALLPLGVQPLSLMQRNPALLDRIASVLGAAPWLAEHLAQVPQALDALVSPGAMPAPGRLMREGLADAQSLEDAIGVIRRIRLELDFLLSVQTLEGRIDVDAAGIARSALAEAAIGALLPFVLAEVRRRFGTVKGGGVVVVALGTLGSRAMMAGSDLDLMLIYDHPAEVGESSAGRSGRAVPVTQYYSRVAQGFIAALTAPGAEGPLYAVDMRLRPSGNAGPVAVSLGSFRRYHRENAWSWERMALTRGRVIAGPSVLAARVGDALLTVIEQAGMGGDAEGALRADAAAMRARLARDRPPEDGWDVKYRVGGLIEVEFIAQTLQLIHAGRHPGLAHPTTSVALGRLRDAGLLAGEDAALLIGADHLWRTIRGMLRVTVGKRRQSALPAASAEAVLRAVGRPGVTDQAGLQAYMDETGAAVRCAFERLIGRPDAALLETVT